MTESRESLPTIVKIALNRFCLDDVSSIIQIHKIFLFFIILDYAKSKSAKN
jgi:hypothetical protein